ncbi:MAG: c-type cytochrome [Pirellulaceae bacterium]
MSRLLPSSLLVAIPLLCVVTCRDAVSGERVDADSIVSLLELVIEVDADTARNCIGVLTEKIQTRELPAAEVKNLRPRLTPLLSKILESGTEHPLYLDAAVLTASAGEPSSLKIAQGILQSQTHEVSQRRRALDALAAGGASQLLDDVSGMLASPKTTPIQLRAAAIEALGRLEQDRVADVLLDRYDQLDAQLQPKAIGVLTQRTAWSKRLLAAIGDDQLPRSVLNASQAAGLLARGDEALSRLVADHWGSLRTDRNPQREAVVAEMRDFLHRTPGDAQKGRVIFQKVCGQCHKIYGQGQDVGPEITANGRSSFEQLLSNVFDPSLVIGAAYQARTVVTDDGRVLTGLLAEDNEQRIVLKTQGGKLETVPRDEVELIKVSELSLMPEGLERQLKPQELADLFAFITLAGPPEDASSQLITGAPTFGENP